MYDEMIFLQKRVQPLVDLMVKKKTSKIKKILKSLR